MDSPSPTNQPTPVVLQTILNKTYEEIKPFSEWLKRNTSNYLIGEHPPAKRKGIHCHILIEGLKVTRESLRKQIIKYAPGPGQNATMSETQDEPKRKYETAPLAIYIIKGHEEYCKSTSFSQEQVTTWSKAWVERKPTDRAPAAVQITKKKPINKFEDCNQILDEYFTNPESLISGAKWYVKVDCQENRSRIVQAIIAWANAHHKAMNSYLVADYYDIILSLAMPEYYQELCVNIINRRHK